MSSSEVPEAELMHNAWLIQWKDQADLIEEVPYEKSCQMLRNLIQTKLLKFTDMQECPEKFFLAHRLLVDPIKRFKRSFSLSLSLSLRLSLIYTNTQHTHTQSSSRVDEASVIMIAISLLSIHTFQRAWLLDSLHSSI